MMKPTDQTNVDKLSNGIFYTPESIARELAITIRKSLDVSNPLRILDPSCGQGALLHETRSIIGLHHIFDGCDLFLPTDKLLYQYCNIHQCNFFDYPTSQKYDLIVTNPPYIQAGKLDRNTKSIMYDVYSKVAPIKQTCDLWVYFLVKSIQHLKVNGTLAAILPWSFLEADYSHSLREWLTKHFEHIQVLVLKDSHFQNTVKRVLLLWLQGYNSETKSIRISYSDRIEKRHPYIRIKSDLWPTSGLAMDVGIYSDSLLSQAQKHGFSPISDYASVSIGVVTGANSYFILNQNDAYNNGFDSESLIPIFSQTRELSGLETCTLPHKSLIQFDNVNINIERYIINGIDKGINLRSHCVRRNKIKAEKKKHEENINLNKWCTVDPGRIPDAIFTYRASKIPYISLNPCGFQCTNAFHKVIFNSSVSKDQMRWIAVSVLSNISQFFFERFGRHYGNGILKIEPSVLKKTLVYAPIGLKMPDSDFRDIAMLLKQDNKEDASLKATDLLKKHVSLPVSYWTLIDDTLKLIRKRRF